MRQMGDRCECFLSSQVISDWPCSFQQRPACARPAVIPSHYAKPAPPHRPVPILGRYSTYLPRCGAGAIHTTIHTLPPPPIGGAHLKMLGPTARYTAPVLRLWSGLARRHAKPMRPVSTQHAAVRGTTSKQPPSGDAAGALALRLPTHLARVARADDSPSRSGSRSSSQASRDGGQELSAQHARSPHAGRCEVPKGGLITEKKNGEDRTSGSARPWLSTDANAMPMPPTSMPDQHQLVMRSELCELDALRPLDSSSHTTCTRRARGYYSQPASQPASEPVVPRAGGRT